uniref:Uncharacterized LOC109997803 n=1 Tax=Labrus bergylta TaxID=56723 RepID=A0A3Q3FZQ2_9LABR|nr:uncharacterized protein LOC109997803 [Labrus bergylta]
MGRRCVFGCASSRCLFPFPSSPWLRRRWLEFTHFEEGGLCANSRLCDRHFSDDSFDNLGMYTAGMACYLSLTENAIPSVYTVGTSPPVKPATRDVACQCEEDQDTPKIHRRSKAIQVRPLTKTTSSDTSDRCGGESDVPPQLTSSPLKRRWSETSESWEITVTTDDPDDPEVLSDSDYVPGDTQDAFSIEELGSACPTLYSTRKYMVYEDNLKQLFRMCPTCTRTCHIETVVVGTFVSVTQVCSHCLHKKVWKSQPHIGSIPAGNLQLSAAVAFNGASYNQIHKVLSSLRLECICPRTFFHHQRVFLQPTILLQRRAEQQQQVIEGAELSGKPITFGADSPDYVDNLQELLLEEVALNPGPYQELGDLE